LSFPDLEHGYYYAGDDIGEINAVLGLDLREVSRDYKAGKVTLLAGQADFKFPYRAMGWRISLDGPPFCYIGCGARNKGEVTGSPGMTRGRAVR
jgi:hypothetical protein